MTSEILFPIPQSAEYQSLPSDARLWIYQANPAFSEADISTIQSKLAQFAKQWVSHNQQLRAYSDIIFNRFIILIVDESMAGASGCSIDSSVRFLQQLGAIHHVDLFDRMNFAWLENGEVKTARSNEFPALFDYGKISNDTLVFDNLVNNKADFEDKWLKPLNMSWHKRFI